MGLTSIEMSSARGNIHAKIGSTSIEMNSARGCKEVIEGRVTINIETQNPNYQQPRTKFALEAANEIGNNRYVFDLGKV